MTWLIPLIIIGLIVWCWIGAEVLMWLDDEEEGFNAELRSDRALFRIFCLLWPIALLLCALIGLAEYWQKRQSGRISDWFRSGGLAHRYIERRQRR